MPYAPDPLDTAQPLDTVEARTAAAEFRTLKAYIQDYLRKLPFTTLSGASPLITQQGYCIALAGDVTIPAALFSSGHVLTFYNDSGTLARSIIQGSGLTMYNAAGGGTGTRTLGFRGLATILFLPTANTCVITGVGLT